MTPQGATLELEERVLEPDLISDSLQKETKPVIKRTRRPRPKLKREARLGKELYNDNSEGVFTPHEIRKFFIDTLDAKLIVNGSWAKGARKTPLDVYLVETKEGTATFTYRAEEFVHSKKSLLEATGNENILENVYRNLEIAHLGLLKQAPVTQLEQKNPSAKRRKQKLEEQQTSGTEIYRNASEGAYTPTEIKKFFTENLGAEMVVDGSWVKGARKTPLQIYALKTDKGIATFTYRAEDYAKSKKSLLEATGDQGIISQIKNSLQLKHSSLLETIVEDLKPTLIPDIFKPADNAYVIPSTFENTDIALTKPFKLKDWVVFAGIATILDSFTTHIALAFPNVQEANPLVRGAMEIFGKPEGVYVHKWGMGALLALTGYAIDRKIYDHRKEDELYVTKLGLAAAFIAGTTGAIINAYTTSRAI